jgi:hypothetical protein
MAHQGGAYDQKRLVTFLDEGRLMNNRIDNQQPNSMQAGVKKTQHLSQQRRDATTTEANRAPADVKLLSNQYREPFIKLSSAVEIDRQTP